MFQYISRAVSRGLATLTEKRFIFYSILSLLALIVSTTLTVRTYYGYRTYSLILSNFAAATALSMLISGGMALIMRRTIERIVETIVILSFLLIGLGLYRYSILFNSIQVCISLCFHSWTVILNLVMFSAIRNFMIGQPNRLIGFKKPKNAILFDIPIKIITSLSVVGFGILIWQSDLISAISGLVAWSISFIMIFFYEKKSKNVVFASIIGLFFVFVAYNLFLCIWNKIGPGIGSLVIDAVIIVAATLYSVQSICRHHGSSDKQKTGTKRTTWDNGAVIALLGAALGYYVFILNNVILGRSSSLLIYRFHQYSILFGAIILVGSVILFVTSLSFRNNVLKRLSPTDLIQDTL